MSLLPSISLSVDAGLLVLIWIVQTIVYPGFQHIDGEKFKVHHQCYTRKMGYLAGPLMIAQLGMAGLALASRPTANLTLLYFVAVCVTWLATFSVSVPLHKKLDELGKHPATLKRLVSTNWIRTATWTLAFAVALFQTKAT